MRLLVLMFNFFVVLYILGVFDFVHVGQRQVRNDYNSGSNINTVGNNNENSGNENNKVAFDKCSVGQMTTLYANMEKTVL